MESILRALIRINTLFFCRRNLHVLKLSPNSIDLSGTLIPVSFSYSEFSFQTHDYETLVEVAAKFYRHLQKMPANFFMKHGKFRDHAWKHFVGLLCSFHYLS